MQSQLVCCSSSFVCQWETSTYEAFLYSNPESILFVSEAIGFHDLLSRTDLRKYEICELEDEIERENLLLRSFNGSSLTLLVVGCPWLIFRILMCILILIRFIMMKSIVIFSCRSNSISFLLFQSAYFRTRDGGEFFQKYLLAVVRERAKRRPLK